MKNKLTKQQVVASLWFRVPVIFMMIVVMSFIMEVVSNHSEYTNVDELKKAEVALLNDDLELALLLYKEAYIQSPDEQISLLINEVEALEASKKMYQSGQEFMKQDKLKEAYESFANVIEEDISRYEIAIDNKTAIANTLIDEHLVQANLMYEQKLYPLVIGQLKQALNYNIRVDEINEHLSKANTYFYDYYLREANKMYTKYLNHDEFYDLFLTKFVYVESFATTEGLRNQAQATKDAIILSATAHYLEKMKEFETIDMTIALKYAEKVLRLDEDQDEAKQFLLKHT